MLMFFFRLQQPPTRMSPETTIWRAGARAEENCAAAEEAGLPSASTASATWLGRIGEYAAALRFPLCLGRPVVEHASERGVEPSAAGRRELAPCDAEGDNLADYCAGLCKARGANERGAAAERCDIFRVTLSGGLGPAGKGGHSGAQRTSGLGQAQGTNRNTKQPLGGWVDEAHAPTQVSALHRAHWIRFSCGLP
jgi:hypothetical protein